MREELHNLLIEVSRDLTGPSNPDLPISAWMNIVFENTKIESAIKSILNQGMTIENGRVLLDYAVDKNNTSLVQCLRLEGIQFDFKTIEARLLNTIVNNDEKKFSELFALMDIDADINRQLKITGWGNTIVQYALFFGRSDIAKKLIEKGADLTVKDWLGSSALGHAIASNNIHCLHLVPITSKEELFRENIYGFSPLHYAVRNHNMSNSSSILDELCQRFELNKEQILNEFSIYPKQRIAQDILVTKLSLFIDIETSKNRISSSSSDPEAISQAVKSGLCHGLSFLFGLHGTKSREDMINFYHALELVAAWDGKEESLSTPITATYMQSTFHTLGDLIKHLSNDAIYFFGQDSLSVIDTPPHDRKTQFNLVNSGNRQIVPILDISMQNMLKEEFVEILKSTLKPNTLLDLTGCAHTISIVCNSQNEIYYYDPNNIYPTVQPIQDLEQLVTLIYHTMPVNFNFQNTAPHYIGVYHLSDKPESNIKKEYPTQEEIVNKYMLNTNRKDNLYAELELCVLQDNPKLLEYLLKSNKLPPLSSKQSDALIDTALNKKSLRSLNKIIRFGNLSQNQMERLEKEPLLANYKEILKTLEDQQSHTSTQIKFFK